MKEDLCVVFSAVFFCVFNIFMVLFSLFLWGILVVSLDGRGGGLQFSDFKLYSNMFLIFAGMYILYRIILKQHYSVLCLSFTYALWIKTLILYLPTSMHESIYSTIIVLYNFLFYSILFIHFYWIEKRKKICSNKI